MNLSYLISHCGDLRGIIIIPVFVALFVFYLYRFLLKVIKLQLKGDFEWAKEIDWMEKASNMPPAAFAELFDGEPDASRQRISRDLKLMDAVFAMSLAMYKRHETSSPWSEDPSNPDLHALAGAKAAQKLFHVALQRMCTANKESQDYFGRRSSRTLEGNVENTDSSQVLELTHMYLDAAAT
jgi:hypothetical protein